MKISFLLLIKILRQLYPKDEIAIMAASKPHLIWVVIDYQGPAYGKLVYNLADQTAFNISNTWNYALERYIKQNTTPKEIKRPKRPVVQHIIEEPQENDWSDDAYEREDLMDGSRKNLY